MRFQNNNNWNIVLIMIIDNIDSSSPAIRVKECRSISISLSDKVPEWTWTSFTSPPRSPRAFLTLATSEPKTRFGCIKASSGKGATALPVMHMVRLTQMTQT